VGQASQPFDNELVQLFELSLDALCIAGFDGYYKLVNPAFARMLGYTQEELLARPFMETIHPDDRESVGSGLADAATGEDIAGFECRQLCADGSVRTLEWNSRTVPEKGVVYAVARDVTDRRGAVAQLSALRRLATLVAEGVQPQELFAVVAEEVAQLFDVPLVGLFRFESDLIATAVAGSGDLSTYIGRSLSVPPDDMGVVASVRRTGRPVRLDDSSEVGLAGPGTGRELGLGSAVGVPVVVEGDVWGVVTLGLQEGRSPLPLDTVDHVTAFTDLVATAISNAEARGEFGRLVEEQASLSRVATLVARGTRPAEVFSAVAEEVGRVLDVDSTTVLRYEADGTMTVVAISGENILTPVGSHWTLDGDSIAGRVFRTGRSARINSFSGAAGPLAEMARRLGRRSAVGAPIIVDGRLWGAAVANSVTVVLPAVAEGRLAKFAELVAMAISNTEARTELTTGSSNGSCRSHCRYAQPRCRHPVRRTRSTAS
jgi:PAS domain S-box-containing protein